MPSLEAEIAQLARFIRSDDHKACIAASRTIFIAQSEEDRWPMEETRTSPGFTRRIARDPHASRKSSTKREGRHESARKSLRLELEMEMKNTHVARHCVASNVKPCEAYSLTSITPRSPLRVTHGTRLGNERDKHVSVTGPPVEGPERRTKRVWCPVLPVPSTLIPRTHAISGLFSRHFSLSPSLALLKKSFFTPVRSCSLAVRFALTLVISLFFFLSFFLFLFLLLFVAFNSRLIVLHVLLNEWYVWKKKRERKRTFREDLIRVVYSITRERVNCRKEGSGWNDRWRSCSTIFSPKITESFPARLKYPTLVSLYHSFPT